MVPQPLATTRKKGMEKKTSEGVILEVIEPMKNVERVTQPKLKLTHIRKTLEVSSFVIII